MNKVRKSSLLVVIACVLVFGISDAHAFAIGDLDVYALAESFTWREFNDAGGQLLRESGPRFGVGAAFTREFSNHLTLNPRIELSGGDVDYIGQTQSGVPVSTTTNYFGAKLELDLGGRTRPSEAFVLEPFAGIGIRNWSRDIKDSTAANGNTALGYTEDWVTVYGRLGLRGVHSWGENNNLFMLAGLKLPIYTEISITDLTVSSSALTLRPGNESSLFAEVVVRLDRFKISAFYDSMRFKKSPLFTANSSGRLESYYQPRSESDMLGVRLGASF